MSCCAGHHLAFWVLVADFTGVRIHVSLGAVVVFLRLIWSGSVMRSDVGSEPVTFPLSTKETRKYESGYEEIDGIVD